MVYDKFGQVYGDRTGSLSDGMILTVLEKKYDMIQNLRCRIFPLPFEICPKYYTGVWYGPL